MNSSMEIAPLSKKNDRLTYLDPGSPNLGMKAKRKIVSAWHALLAFDLARAQQLAGQLRDMAPTAPLQQRMLNQQADLIVAGIALFNDDIGAVVQLANKVAGGDQTEEMARTTSVLLRFAAWYRRDWDCFEEATCLCPCSLIDGRQALPTVLTLIIEAAAEMKRSRFISAHRLASDALRFAARLKSGKALATASAVTVMAAILHEQGEIEEADKLLRRNLESLSRSACADVVAGAYETLMQIAMHRCQWGVASTFQRELIALGNARSWPRLVAFGLAAGVESECLTGAVARAAASVTALRQLQDAQRLALVRSAISLRLRVSDIRLSLLGSPSAQLVADIEAHLRDLSAQGEELQTSGVAMLLVEALTVTGEDQAAQAALLAYLRAGMRRGVFQSFVTASTVVYEKLNDLYNDGLDGLEDQAQMRPFLASLIARTRKFLLAKVGSAELFTETLITARERDILLRMSQGYSNKKIAKDLGIGPETVKSHAKRIYSKLGVTSRIEAVSQAADLCLI
nr:LuxR C-terminal-related transcriptional regulator [Herbaspirillum sp. ASV7]